jgi:lipopolysaccharide transport system permease protein
VHCIFGSMQLTGAAGESNTGEIIIEPKRRWGALDLREVYAYRDMLRLFVWRNIKARYAQAVIGIGWAVLQPVAYMIVFSLVFGRLTKIPSLGEPYPLFSFIALVPWTYFASATSDAAASLVGNASLLTKVYFPRLILPLASVIAKLLDFFIGLLLLGGLMLFFGRVPGPGVLAIPLLILILVAATAGVGMWLTALAVRYRDVSYALPLTLQLLLYASPVVYSVTLISPQFRVLYALNPMVGVIAGFRAAMFNQPMPWDLVLVGALTAYILLASGAWYFQSRESDFADII